jgi:dihydrofolate reductase
MTLSLILAVSENDVIGKDGKIPWFVRGEQKRFKELTLNHPIIMGRKTHESIGTELPMRTNIVITSNPNYRPYGQSVRVGSLDEALQLPQVKKADEVFVIGGQQVFDEAMPLANRLYLTRVQTVIDGGDKFFVFDPSEWKLVSSEHYEKDAVPDRPFDFDISIYDRLPS